MDHDKDPDAPAGNPAIDHPLDMLLRDHAFVRRLADTWQQSQDEAVKRQAATQLLQALHTHSRVEESVFYPGVRQLDPAMIGHFEQDHLAVDDLLATLQGMDLGGAHAQRLMQELLTAVLSHIEEEERDFFPKIAAAHMDLAPLGLQMHALEANLIHMQAQQDQPARR